MKDAHFSGLVGGAFFVHTIYIMRKKVVLPEDHPQLLKVVFNQFWLAGESTLAV